MNRDSLKLICELATSEKDRRLIWVAARQGLTSNTARRLPGISDVIRKSERVNSDIEEYLEIKRAVKDIALAKETVASSKALLLWPPFTSSIK